MMVAMAPLFVLALGIALAASGGGTLRVQGSTTVNPICAEVAEALEARGLSITVDPQGGSAGGLAALAAGQVDIAMSSKPVTARERASYPAVAFHETPIGLDAVALVVSRPVWDGGVRAIDRAKARALFEGR